MCWRLERIFGAATQANGGTLAGKHTCQAPPDGTHTGWGTSPALSASGSHRLGSRHHWAWVRWKIRDIHPSPGPTRHSRAEYIIRRRKRSEERQSRQAQQIQQEQHPQGQPKQALRHTPHKRISGNEERQQNCGKEDPDPTIELFLDLDFSGSGSRQNP